MIELKQKTQELLIYFGATIVTFMFLIALATNKMPTTAGEWYDLFGNASLFSTGLFFVFLKRLWRYKPFSYFVDQPYVGGKWEGVLKYEFPKGTKGEKKISVDIKQDYLRTSVFIDTGDGNTSYSYHANFCATGDNHIKHLVYSYIKNSPASQRHTNPDQEGSVKLAISEDCKVMKGSYWTTLQTIGDIELKRKEEK